MNLILKSRPRRYRERYWLLETIHPLGTTVKATLYFLKLKRITRLSHGYDRYYRFEGYKVYQLANAEVGADELSNTDKARLVFQCDVRNNVGRLLNYDFDESLQANVPNLKVDGGDAGITHSFVITEDKFSTKATTRTWSTTSPIIIWLWPTPTTTILTYKNLDDATGLLGQKKPYLEGRKNIQVLYRCSSQDHQRYCASSPIW